MAHADKLQQKKIKEEREVQMYGQTQAELDVAISGWLIPNLYTKEFMVTSMLSDVQEQLAADSSPSSVEIVRQTLNKAKYILLKK